MTHISLSAAERKMMAAAKAHWRQALKNAKLTPPGEYINSSGGGWSYRVITSTAACGMEIEVYVTTTKKRIGTVCV